MLSRCALLTVVCLFLASTCFAADADQSKDQTLVIKFAVYKDGASGGHPCKVIAGSIMGGGGNVDLAVPNKDANAAKADPDGTIDSAVSGAKAGDLLECAVTVTGAARALKSVSSYTAKPGEDELNVYVFDQAAQQKVGEKDTPAVSVTKYKKPFAFLVPMVKGEDGNMAADEKVNKIITGLTSGDSVVIKAGAGTPPTIVSIAKYEAPKRGTFSKISKTTVDGTDVTAVEFSELGSTSTVAVSPTDGATVLAAARNIKPGSEVTYRTTTDDKGNIWLADLKAVPQTVAAKTPDKPNTNTNNTNANNNNNNGGGNTNTGTSNGGNTGNTNVGTVNGGVGTVGTVGQPGTVGRPGTGSGRPGRIGRVGG